MLLKYIGHRPFITQTFNHKQILFDKSNGFQQDIKEQEVIIELISTGNFIPIEREIAGKKESVSVKDEFQTNYEVESQEPPIILKKKVSKKKKV